MDTSLFGAQCFPFNTPDTTPLLGKLPLHFRAITWDLKRIFGPRPTLGRKYYGTGDNSYANTIDNLLQFYTAAPVGSYPGGSIGDAYIDGSSFVGVTVGTGGPFLYGEREFGTLAGTPVLGSRTTTLTGNFTIQPQDKSIDNYVTGQVLPNAVTVSFVPKNSDFYYLADQNDTSNWNGNPYLYGNAFYGGDVLKPGIVVGIHKTRLQYEVAGAGHVFYLFPLKVNNQEGTIDPLLWGTMGCNFATAFEPAGLQTRFPGQIQVRETGPIEKIVYRSSFRHAGIRRNGPESASPFISPFGGVSVIIDGQIVTQPDSTSLWPLFDCSLFVGNVLFGELYAKTLRDNSDVYIIEDGFGGYMSPYNNFQSPSCSIMEHLSTQGSYAVPGTLQIGIARTNSGINCVPWTYNPFTLQFDGATQASLNNFPEYYPMALIGGGWLNIDDTESFFTYAPRTYKINSTPYGFLVQSSMEPNKAALIFVGGAGYILFDFVNLDGTAPANNEAAFDNSSGDFNGWISMGPDGSVYLVDPASNGFVAYDFKLQGVRSLPQVDPSGLPNFLTKHSIIGKY